LWAQRWTHISAHFAPLGTAAEDVAAVALKQRKSLFFADEDPWKLLTYAVNAPAYEQKSGPNFARIMVADHIVGFDKFAYDGVGEYTEVYTVITRSDGSLVTMFPGIPQQP
jgi:hypothetical protein